MSIFIYFYSIMFVSFEEFVKQVIFVNNSAVLLFINVYF